MTTGGANEGPGDGGGGWHGGSGSGGGTGGPCWAPAPYRAPAAGAPPVATEGGAAEMETTGTNEGPARRGNRQAWMMAGEVGAAMGGAAGAPATLSAQGTRAAEKLGSGEVAAAGCGYRGTSHSRNPQFLKGKGSDLPLVSYF